MGDEIGLDVVKKRAVKGVAVLTGRTFVLKLIEFFSFGLLWAFLDPSQYGVFLIASATVNFLSYFADIGLGAALIQKKEVPQEVDYRTVFTVQEILVSVIFIIVLLLGPVLTKTHSLTHEGLMLLYALGGSFFLASLKNIPSIQLERKLEFGKFIIPQVLENMVYSVVVVFFAWKGFGITSFTYAVLIRGVVGLIAIYILNPWKPGLGFNLKSFKNLIKFGIPYQLNNFLATVKDDGMIIVLGGILGTVGVGILGTAKKLAEYPLRFFMDNVTKVTFPAFSRMQDDKAELEKSLTRSIFFICALVFPSLIGLVVVFPVLIAVIPRYAKWSPAYIPLIFLSVNSLWAAGSTQLTNFLNSVGKIKTTFKLMIMWTALTWALVPVLSIKFGVNGAAFSYLLIGSSSVVVFYIVKKYLNWSIYHSVIVPLLSSLVMGGAIFILRNILLINNVKTLVIMILAGGLTYLGFLYLVLGNSLVDDVKKIYFSVLKK
ncbi:MAG: oligosaccharide flippase family protein [Patescibacteria group bacterium]